MDDYQTWRALFDLWRTEQYGRSWRDSVISELAPVKPQYWHDFLRALVDHITESELDY